MLYSFLAQLLRRALVDLSEQSEQVLNSFQKVRMIGMVDLQEKVGLTTTQFSSQWRY